ncbi:MAG: NTP transferase domain-containing protein [candidate division Zixibacteria bacterium]|nr:NTP transferase domain-containing protein [candidate division Zixibacteria bacterium]
MKAVIMAGGFGTRLRPLSCSIPKPMVYVANKPMMEYMVNLLKKHGLVDLVVLLYFQAETIRNYFGDGSKFGVRIEYIQAQEDYGTAGAVKNAEGLLNERFLVISADVLTDIDLKAACDFHQKNQAKATMVLAHMENPLSYGVVITQEDGKISRFLEKPTWGEVFSDTVNTGIYILEPEVLEETPSKKNFDFSKNLFPHMLSTNQQLYGFVTPDYWRDVGNVEEYFQAHQDILEGGVRVDIGGNLLHREHASIWVGKNVSVGEKVEFKGTVIIGHDAQIGSHCFISNSVIGEDVRIGEDVNLDRSVIWKDASIGKRSILTEAIVANNATVEEETVIFENAIISENCHIEKGAKIKANVRVWPGKRVEAGSILSSSLVWGERWNRELFTDAKVMGVGNLELTPEFAVKLGAAYGAMLGKGSTVVTSRDAGSTSRMISRALICGLLSAGVNVNDLRTLPIPVVRYELKSGKERGGIHTRRSPLDPRQTDIVFFNGGGRDLPTFKTKSVERLFFREDFRRASPEETGQLDFPQRVIESYRRDFLRAIDSQQIRKAQFKVVVDYSNGGACEIFPSIIGALGCEAISLNAYLDPQKLSRSEEELSRSIQQLSSIVKSVNADVGFLFDPGAEKLTVVDEEGEPIQPDLLLLMVTSLFLGCTPAHKIAVPVVASMGVERIAAAYGVEVIRVRNDHLAMMDALSNLGVDFVGGTRGGFIFPGFQLGADAMFNVAKILELLPKNGNSISGPKKKSLADLRKELDQFHMVRRTVPCSWRKKGQVMRELSKYTEDCMRELIDGVRVLNTNSWVLVMPDRRKASFHIFAEATEEGEAGRLLEKYASKVDQWQR